jgi:hypothetical protein
MMRRLRGSATPADELREEISKHLSILMDAGLIDLQALSAPTRQIANCHVDGRDPRREIVPISATRRVSAK